MRFGYTQYSDLMAIASLIGVPVIAIMVAMTYVCKWWRQNVMRHKHTHSPVIPLHSNPLSDQYMFSVSYNVKLANRNHKTIVVGIWTIFFQGFTLVICSILHFWNH